MLKFREICKRCRSGIRTVLEGWLNIPRSGLLVLKRHVWGYQFQYGLNRGHWGLLGAALSA